MEPKTKGASTTPFRICIIEDQSLFRKGAEVSIKEIFHAGHYTQFFSLTIEAPSTYQILIKECKERLKSGYYDVVLVDNELSSYPDYAEASRPMTGIELVTGIVKTSRPKTAFILNSSSNFRFLETNPKLLDTFACIPKAGKNSEEAFEQIDALMRAKAAHI